MYSLKTICNLKGIPTKLLNNYKMLSTLNNFLFIPNYLQVKNNKLSRWSIPSDPLLHSSSQTVGGRRKNNIKQKNIRLILFHQKIVYTAYWVLKMLCAIEKHCDDANFAHKILRISTFRKGT